MRTLITLTCVAAATVLAGCATDAESPFAVRKNDSAKPAPAPAPAVVESAPAEIAPVPVDAGEPIVVAVTQDSQFKINGADVSWDDFAATVTKLGKDNPGKPVTLELETGYSARIVQYVFDTCKTAGLGKVQAK